MGLASLGFRFLTSKVKGESVTLTICESAAVHRGNIAWSGH